MPDLGRLVRSAEETDRGACGDACRDACRDACARPARPAETGGVAGADVRQERLRAVFRRLGDELRCAESALAELVEEGAAGDGPVRVETVEGRAAQAQRLLRLETGARRTFQAFLTGFNTVTPVPHTLTDQSGRTAPADPGGSDGGQASRPTAPPGVTYQLLVDRDFLAEPAAVTALEERTGRGEQVRVVDNPLIKLAVADGDVAMVQVSPERAVLLRPPLVMLATELFAAVWRHSRPYLREGVELSPVDRQILQLMLSGLTDAATAKQLGTSPRTVQRRLRALMDLTSVTSRLQLGWYAMRNNWV
ncbi:helix-turn-helix transcriptional regulator [Streptomyces sp. Q6]|uniref:Helix-turn-helix transcriptional regulator n=1 Tax=Streptomyces citrinus TaxID=3118173 RepID=A0ACD5A8L6_9ACTN